MAGFGEEGKGAAQRRLAEAKNGGAKFGKAWVMLGDAVLRFGIVLHRSGKV